MDKNGVTFDVNWVSGNRLNRLASTILSRCYIKLGAVPGTNDNATKKTSFCQRAGTMRTAVADGIKYAIYIEQRNLKPFDFNQHTFTRR